ncbi:MAG TPA: hypothetical protein VFL14_03925, partial [Xanthomonadales bacterium]|nr:hypothetical protein [Xanthomonadales bacterium]
DAALAAFAKEAPGNTEQQAMLAQRRSELALLRGDAHAARQAAGEAREHAQAAHVTAVLAAAELADARAAAAAGDARAAKAALARADEILTHYPSLPLALLRAEVAGDTDARAKVAQLPGYGRAWRLDPAVAKPAWPATPEEGKR